MDIIIKNVEMPKDCKSCFCSYCAAPSYYGAESDGDICEVADKEIDYFLDEGDIHREEANQENGH